MASKVAGRQLLRQLGHGGWEVVLEELWALGRGDGRSRCAPTLAQRVELPHVGGLLATWPRQTQPLQVGRQSVGVTQQRHPLARLGQSPRLLAGQVGLAAARTAAYLYAVQQLDGPEDHRLLLGEPVGRLLVFQGAGHDVALGQPAPGEHLFQ